jgi:glutathione synthase/RimK-type ligase-like ATP-grasp enzyme
MTNQTKTNYILHREGSGDGLVDVPLFTQTDLKFGTKDNFPDDLGYVFRWGCTANIPPHQSTVNPASAIHKAFNKRAFRAEMNEEDLCPETWMSVAGWLEMTNGQFPILIRKNNHSRSEDMYVCNTIVDAIRVGEDLGKGNYYISELIQKTKEYRVMFCSGRVIGIIEKIPSNASEVSWGCVESGNYRYIEWTEWPLEVTKKAMEAVSMSGLDFGAVDVICGPTGTSGPNRPYVLEINSAPWLSPYFTKIFTQAFDYIVQNGKDLIPIVHGDSFHGYIHPSRYAGATV